MEGLNEVIPTLDLHETPDKLLNQKIREASERWGCFKVTNHGVPFSLMAKMKKTVTDLHERPVEMKMRNTDVILGSGYKPIIELNPLYESFGVFDMASPLAANTFCDLLEASADQREILVKYGKAIGGLAKDLARRLVESYGLAGTDLCQKWPCQFRISKYHFKPETIGRNGLILHTDPGFLTVLQGDDDVGGLEVVDPSSGNYIPINTSPNTLTVNLGDMAKIWSNGRLCNVKHRVQCKEAKTRITISCFLLAPTDRVVEPPSEFVDAEHPRLFKPVSDGELRRIRLRHDTHAGESLNFVTLKYLNDQNID